jgi:hypothetical protein
MADFFNKVKQGLSQGVSTASVKSKEVLEIAKIKNQITVCVNQKRELVEELGNIVYVMYSKENINIDRISDKCAGIRDVDLRIQNFENEILEVQRKSRDSLGLSSVFGKCECGVEYFEGKKFCGSCGKNLSR